MIVRVPALANSIPFEITRGFSTYELYALRLILARDRWFRYATSIGWLDNIFNSRLYDGFGLHDCIATDGLTK